MRHYSAVMALVSSTVHPAVAVDAFATAAYAADGCVTERGLELALERCERVAMAFHELYQLEEQFEADGRTLDVVMDEIADAQEVGPGADYAIYIV